MDGGKLVRAEAQIPHMTHVHPSPTFIFDPFSQDPGHAEAAEGVAADMPWIDSKELYTYFVATHFFVLARLAIQETATPTEIAAEQVQEKAQCMFE